MLPLEVAEKAQTVKTFNAPFTLIFYDFLRMDKLLQLKRFRTNLLFTEITLYIDLSLKP